MKSTLIVFLFGLWSVLGIAAETDQGSLSYSGSRGDQNLSLQTETMRTEYRWVQVPYQERVCRTETRYRRECRQEPPRRQCRQEPPRRQCRTVNKPVCRIVNGRRVCRDRPVRVCRDIPGRRVCRDIPGRRVCRDVPYQHRVCRMETRYRQERRAYQVVDRRTYANINFNFRTVGDTFGIRSDIRANLDREFLTIRTEDFSSPRRALVYSLVDSRDQRGRDTHITKSYSVRVISAHELFRPLDEVMTSSEISNGLMTFELGLMEHPSDTKLALRVTSGPVLFDRELSPSDFQLNHDGSKTQVAIDLARLLGNDYSGRELSIEFIVRVPRESLLNSNQFSKFEKRELFNRVWR
ncbi:MAG: hypothetical protein CME70_22095 [Halobacteriovorax sp.]|nr:hypothetical protein [Halobacteriovorax sp.]